MTEFKLTLKNAEGLHARPAGVLAKSLSAFESKVEIAAKGQIKNAKSIMSLMSLGLSLGDELEFRVSGSDEVLAAAKIQELVESEFRV